MLKMPNEDNMLGGVSRWHDQIKAIGLSLLQHLWVSGGPQMFNGLVTQIERSLGLLGRQKFLE